ncbi:hypothetical protein Gotur_016849 [Gossypium turneri]
MREEAIAMASTSPLSISSPEAPMVLHVSNRRSLLNSLRRHLSDFSRPLHGFAFLQGLPNHSFLISSHPYKLSSMSCWQERYMVTGYWLA